MSRLSAHADISSSSAARPKRGRSPSNLAGARRSRRDAVARRPHGRAGCRSRAGAHRRLRRRRRARRLSRAERDRCADRRDASLRGAHVRQRRARRRDRRACRCWRCAGRPGQQSSRRPLDRGRDSRGRRAALGEAPRRVFLALGRKELAPFAAAPQHRLSHPQRRSGRAAARRAARELHPARGPFTEADERALLETHRIEIIVAKNSGGDATYGKIAAARALGIAVVMLRRPALPEVAIGRRRSRRCSPGSIMRAPPTRRGV